MSVDRRIPRLERLEAKLRPPPPALSPLGALERRELAELEASHAARFPGPVESWDQGQLHDYLHCFTPGADYAERLDELRRRGGFFNGSEETEP